MGEKPFCEICGKLLKIICSGETSIGICVSCNYTRRLHSEFTVTEKSQKKEPVGTGVEIKKETPDFPHLCKKCGYKWCDISQVSASYSDESDICLYKCKKCSFTERQADGTGNA